MSEDQVKRLEKCIARIEIALFGGIGDDGKRVESYLAKIDQCYEWIMGEKQTKRDIWTHVYRTLLGIGIVYICYKLGISKN